ncbi:MAG TPA: fatty acid desaturase [Flavitalea sp.]|nr:fatty acid desaturase [Flavitalea sp.]
MINNLEGIPFESVINEVGEPYDNFRKRLFPIYKKVWMDISFLWMLLIIPFILYPFIPIVLHWPIAFLLMFYFGYLLAALHLFIHEAAHFNIHPDKKTNDVLAAYLICPFFGIDMKKYRKTHWAHHLHLGSPDDVEISYFNALTFPFLVKTLTGAHVWKIIQTRRNKNPDHEEGTINFRVLIRTIIVHAVFIITAWYTGRWSLVIGWVVGTGMIFPFLATLRQMLEHRDELAGKDHQYYSSRRNRLSRIFGKDLLSRSFGAAGFNRHMIHHWDPHISYTRLDDIIHFLEKAPLTQHIIVESRTTYKKVFTRLLSAP